MMYGETELTNGAHKATTECKATDESDRNATDDSSNIGGVEDTPKSSASQKKQKYLPKNPLAAALDLRTCFSDVLSNSALKIKAYSTFITTKDNKPLKHSLSENKLVNNGVDYITPPTENAKFEGDEQFSPKQDRFSIANCKSAPGGMSWLDNRIFSEEDICSNANLFDCMDDDLSIFSEIYESANDDDLCYFSCSFTSDSDLETDDMESLDSDTTAKPTKDEEQIPIQDIDSENLDIPESEGEPEKKFVDPVSSTLFNDELRDVDPSKQAITSDSRKQSLLYSNAYLANSLSTFTPILLSSDCNLEEGSPECEPENELPVCDSKSESDLELNLEFLEISDESASDYCSSGSFCLGIPGEEEDSFSCVFSPLLNDEDAQESSKKITPTGETTDPLYTEFFNENQTARPSIVPTIRTDIPKSINPETDSGTTLGGETPPYEPVKKATPKCVILNNNNAFGVAHKDTNGCFNNFPTRIKKAPAVEPPAKPILPDQPETLLQGPYLSSSKETLPASIESELRIPGNSTENSSNLSPEKYLLYTHNVFRKPSSYSSLPNYKVRMEEMLRDAYLRLKNMTNINSKKSLREHIPLALGVVENMRMIPAEDRVTYCMVASKIMMKIASYGDAEAQYRLANLYISGITIGKKKIIRQNNTRAFSLYVSASKQDHKEALFHLGICYEHGIGVRKSRNRALVNYKKSAMQNHPGAMFRLGMCLLSGEMKQTKSPRDGIKWLKLSAKYSNEKYPQALYQLALLHDKGLPNIIWTDHNYLVQLLSKAAALNHVPSQCLLGETYEYGNYGATPDPGKSVYYYSLAAANGSHEAMFELGGWYLTGVNDEKTGFYFPQSETLALDWIKLSAMANLPKGMYALAYFYEVGIGCDRDIEKCKYWYNSAARHGDQRAKERLEREFVDTPVATPEERVNSIAVRHTLFAPSYINTGNFGDDSKKSADGSTSGSIGGSSNKSDSADILPPNVPSPSLTSSGNYSTSSMINPKGGINTKRGKDFDIYTPPHTTASSQLTEPVPKYIKGTKPSLFGFKSIYNRGLRTVR